MSTVIPAAAGWLASRRARAGEVETKRVLAFILSDPQTPVAPVIIGDDGLVSQDAGWVVWNENSPAEAPQDVLEALHASGGGDVEQWTPAARYEDLRTPVITEIPVGQPVRGW